MGWWSETIMGGDTPLDIEGNLLVDVCGINFDDYIDLPITAFKHTFNKRLVEMLHYVETEYEDNERNIAFQVLGVLLITAGSDVPVTLKALIKKAAERDEWAAESDGRRKHIADFVEAVCNYKDGEPVEITSEGLFEKIAEGMNKDG